MTTEAQAERAFLVGVDRGRSPDGWSPESSLEELKQLALSAGAEVVGRLSQRLKEPSRHYYLGKGKLQELVQRQAEAGATTVIFDDELSPLQQRNLENALGVKVIDRATLILDIFARRAMTREGQLQVELAQHQYLLPRLAGQWQHLERLGGGIGTRGPGETQIETDRRLARRRIDHIRREIERVRQRRHLYRRQRRKTGILSVSLVGYTNAGKSTLLNALTRAEAAVGDRLFATLDPITRRFRLPDGRTVLLSDTVGFIHKLPPAIAAAFRATLEELDEADLLLHLVDLSSPGAAPQCQAVEDILDELGIGDRPRLTVLNKIDRLLPDGPAGDEAEAMAFFRETPPLGTGRTVPVSAANGWGLKELCRQMAEMLQTRPGPAGEV